MEIDGERVLETVSRYASIPVLSLLFVFMLAVRLMPIDSVLTDRGVLYSGNDPWYHIRIVRLVVENFPAAPAFDAWSRFPFGTGRHSGFGGLFDQLIAYAAILAGGGSPSPTLVDTVGAIAPAVFGAATVIPAYYIGKMLQGRATGLLSAGILAFASGQFLNRTMVGSPDHQSAEALFGTIAVLGFMAALWAAYEYKPTTALVFDGDWEGLRPFLTVAVVGGVGIASYLMLWPPGVMLVFSFGVFGVLQAVRDHLRDAPLDYTVFGVGTPLLVAAVLTALYAKEAVLESTAFSLLQPLVAGGIAVGMVYLLVLSREADDRDYDPWSYPVFVVGSFLAVFAVMAVVYPRGIDLFTSLITRIYSFGLLTSPGTLTVAEISPASPVQAWATYGFLFFIAVGGLALLVYRVVLEDRPLELVVLLWSLTMFSAYFTMIRFGYYVAVNIAIVSAFALVWFVRDIMELSFDVSSIEDVKGYEVLTLVILVMLLVPGNLVAVAGTSGPVWDSAPNLAGTSNYWMEELDWMRNNTPEEPLEYTEYYDVPEDGDFDYPVDESPLKGAYGVMSWWDYGHWLTVRGQRIPVANPFQQNEIPASDFFTSLSEERANLILEALPSIPERQSEIHNMSDEELRSIVGDQGDQERYEDTRYVVIDDQSAGGKFNAIATWTQFSGYVSREPFVINNKTQRLPATNDVYDNTTLARLYHGDADGMESYRLVHESERYTLLASMLDRRRGRVLRVNRALFRKQYDAAFQPGTGLTMKDISSLSDRQVVPIGQTGRILYDLKGTASVKTFERVPGATITGTADVDGPTEVTAVAQLQTTNTQRNFTYSQEARTDADGSFAITVPYATEGDVGLDEGGTNESVRAWNSYRVIVGNVTVRDVFGQTALVGNAMESGSVEVTERAVYEGDSVPVQLAATATGTGNRTAG